MKKYKIRITGYDKTYNEYLFNLICSINSDYIIANYLLFDEYEIQYEKLSDIYYIIITLEKTINNIQNFVDIAIPKLSEIINNTIIHIKYKTSEIILSTIESK